MNPRRRRTKRHRSAAKHLTAKRFGEETDIFWVFWKGRCLALVIRCAGNKYTAIPQIDYVSSSGNVTGTNSSIVNTLIEWGKQIGMVPKRNIWKAVLDFLNCYRISMLLNTRIQDPGDRLLSEHQAP